MQKKDQPQEFSLLLQYRDDGHAFLERAISHEEQGEIRTAIDFYEKGISKMNACLQIYSVKTKEAREVHEKVSKTMEMAQERLHILSSQQHRKRIITPSSSQSPLAVKKKDVSAPINVKGIDRNLANVILNDVLEDGTGIYWDDIGIIFVPCVSC